MEKQAVRIVVSGEVDHGKSTLIGRLMLEAKSLPREKLRELEAGMALAFLADQLKEERDEERTIETTQIFFQTRKRMFCLIDTPGHLEFIKNMMTGATRADAALVIIDAQSGLTPQARRHMSVLGLVGFRHVIVAVNKMDLVGYSPKRFLRIKKDATRFLRRNRVVTDHVIPISAKNGDNVAARSRALKWHKGPLLLETLEALKPRRMDAKKDLRLPIQDIYHMDGDRIVVGRVESGRLRLHQPVVVLPRGEKARVASIKTVSGHRPIVLQGENAGIVLEGCARVGRGDVLCGSRGAPDAKRRFKGSVFWFSDKPLRSGEMLTMRCATQQTTCVIQGASGVLDPHEITRVCVATAAPIVIEASDILGELGRFVLERGGVICGVGIIAP